jgi:CPA1 family monovalent cation:H+ antiporter
VVTEFWEFLAFFVNSIVFLLIGDQINFASLGKNLDVIVVTVGALLLTRAVAIYGLGGLSNWLANSRIGWRTQMVLLWGGLRGSVSLALALSLPDVLPGREMVIDIVFGVVLFTLLVQGLTIQLLLQKLGLLGEQPLRQQYSEAIARRIALQRVLEFLSQAKLTQEIEPEFYRDQLEFLQQQLKSLQVEITQLQNQHPFLRTLNLEQLQEKLFNIEADTYAELTRNGLLDQQLSPLFEQIIAAREENR